VPNVSLAATKQYYNNLNKGIAADQFADAYAVGIFLNWNLFDGGGSLARQLMSAHEQESADALLRAAQLKAPNDFEVWRRRVIYNVSLYRARARAIESAEESVRLARLSYAAGTRTNTDVLDAELDLFRARAGAVKAQLDSAEALVNLELALGHKI
jgi:outer membrane protein TolC